MSYFTLSPYCPDCCLDWGWYNKDPSYGDRDNSTSALPREGEFDGQDPISQPNSTLTMQTPLLGTAPTSETIPLQNRGIVWDQQRQEGNSNMELGRDQDSDALLPGGKSFLQTTTDYTRKIQQAAKEMGSSLFSRTPPLDYQPPYVNRSTRYHALTQTTEDVTPWIRTNQQSKVRFGWGEIHPRRSLYWEDLYQQENRLNILDWTLASENLSPTSLRSSSLSKSSNAIVAEINDQLKTLQEQLEGFAPTTKSCTETIRKMLDSPLLSSESLLRGQLAPIFSKRPSEDLPSQGNKAASQAAEHEPSYSQKVVFLHAYLDALTHDLISGYEPLSELSLLTPSEIEQTLQKRWLLWKASPAFYILSAVEKLQTYYDRQEATFKTLEQLCRDAQEQAKSPEKTTISSKGSFSPISADPLTAVQKLRTFYQELLIRKKGVDQAMEWLQKIIDFYQSPQATLEESSELSMARQSFADLQNQYEILLATKLGGEEIITIARLTAKSLYHYGQAIELLLEGLCLPENQRDDRREYFLRTFLYEKSAKLSHSFKDQLFIGWSAPSLSHLDEQSRDTIEILLERALKLAPPSMLLEGHAKELQKRYYFSILESVARAVEGYHTNRASAPFWEGISQGLEEILGIEQELLLNPTQITTELLNLKVKQLAHEKQAFQMSERSDCTHRERWEKIPAFLAAGRALKVARHFQEKIEHSEEEVSLFSEEELLAIMNYYQGAAQAYSTLNFIEARGYVEAAESLIRSHQPLLLEKFPSIEIGTRS